MGRCSFECDEKNGWCDCDGKHLNGCEVNSQTDKNNCGACGLVCPAPANFVASCVKGVCKKECKYGYKQCGSSCVRVTSNVNNCGGCGIVCHGGANGTAMCIGGTCGVQCKAGYIKCDGECSKLSSNLLNCGKCGTMCHGGENGTAVCVGGHCDLQCNSGYTKCNGTCVNVDVDVMNCRLCGTVCFGDANGVGVCVGGTCDLDCMSSYTKCNGTCVDVITDVMNCGSCKTECLEGENGMAVCVDGHCDLDCNAGSTKCNGKCVDVDTDIMNCGSCGMECDGENGTPMCIGGECRLDCNSDSTKCNGKCVNVNTDIMNCGSCGTECDGGENGLPTCVGGHCILRCNDNYIKCHGQCVRLDIFSTVGHTCNKGVYYCGSNSCYHYCASDFEVCNEYSVDLNYDEFNCGSCGNECFGTQPRCFCGECLDHGCFPGDATITLASGGLKRMLDLMLGDQVAVRGRNGGVAYEDVYAFGHRDALASTSFVQLTVKPIDRNLSDRATESRTLEVTALHFVPVSTGLAGTLIYKRARDVIVGDRMWADGSAMVEVTGISEVHKQGLYKPFTLGGTIIVNGVLASTHSEWFLDGVFEALGLVQWLPWAYQALLLPVRTLYCVVGKDAYIALYRWLHAVVDLVAFGGKHGGCIATASAPVGLFVLAKASRRT